MAIKLRATNIKTYVKNTYTTISESYTETAEKVLITATNGDLEISSAKRVVFQGLDGGVQLGREVEFDPIVVPKTPIIINAYWTDENNKKIHEAFLTDKVRYHITTKGIANGSVVNVSIWDEDSPLSDNYITTTQITVNDNKGYAEILLKQEWDKYIKKDVGNEIELYGECEYNGQSKEFDANSEILNVAERGEIITVFVELPHTKETDYLNAKGLGGHTAIMIGNEFYDYGPQPLEGENKRGSKGRPWWDRPNITKDDFLILLSTIKGRNSKGIVGKCILMDICVKKKEKEDVEQWWINKYNDLGTYSVYIINGSQCTTTVRQSLEEKTSIFSWTTITKTTQTPKGLVELLTTKARHTAGRNVGELVTITKTYAEYTKKQLENL